MTKQITTKGTKKGTSSLGKGLQLLEILASTNGEQGLSSLAKLSSINISTVYRLLSILEEKDFVARNPCTKGYKLGTAVIHMGESARRSLNLVNQAQPILEKLAFNTGETSSLDIIINDRSTIISQVVGTPPYAVNSVVGAQVHLHACASGKVLLSGQSIDRIDQILSEGIPQFTPNTISSHEKVMEELELVKSNGYALDKEERFIGLRCVAAPVYDHTDTIIAAIHISSPVIRMTETRFLDLIPHVVDAGLDLSSLLGWRSRNNLS